jgi:preprotein translocase subunit SecA
VIASLATLVRKVFGSRNDRVLRGMLPLVEAVNALEPEFEALSDDALLGKTEAFRRRIREGETLDDLLPEAFAAVREAAKRTIGQRPFDVQILGGIVLHRGGIAEMVTGEGKTLTAVAPAYLNALTGRGVHIVTVNDYLARRDGAWMGPVFGALGMRVGVIQAQMRSDERIPQYEADVTYGTNSEFGFDYLRDNMRTRAEDQCQKDRHYAIIDEVDSILIDEARTPLIISGPAEEATDKYYLADRVVRRWKAMGKGIDKADLDEMVEKLAKGPEREQARLEAEKPYYYVVSEKSNTAYLTESGVLAAQEDLGVGDFYDSQATLVDWPHHLEQAVRAHALFQAERDYVVRDGEVVIVDEFTGRLMEGRRWSDGLHQAIEAKEGLKIREENQTLATVTIQNFFRLYDKLAGMTGTALTEAGEFYKIYKLDVIVVPTNRPLIRVAHDDRVFLREDEKYRAVVREIVSVHRTGRPILVGTTSIEKSERLSGLLRKEGIAHEVLNAKHHEREAAIVAKAGQLGAVTIATNMAGRGTDILLGTFAFEELLEHWRRHGLAPKDARADDPALFDRLHERWLEVYFAEEPERLAAARSGDAGARRRALLERWAELRHHPLPSQAVTSVAALGGLHIVGTERHEARRIDNQLRGRSGRQGDPGSSVFFVSLEDDLMRKFARDWVKRMLARLGMGEGQEVSYPMVTRAIERAQRKVEEQNFDIRKNLLEYDKVNDEQRKAIYERRNAILRGERLEETAFELIDLLLGEKVATHLPSGEPVESWETSELAAWAHRKFGVELSGEALRAAGSPEAARAIVRERIDAAVARAKEAMGEADFHRTLRFLLLRAFDEKWKDHLRELDGLRSGIGLRGYAQVDPKVEYRREASQMFEEMSRAIAESVTDGLLRVHVTESLDDALSGRWRPTRAGQPEVASLEAAADTAPIGSVPERLEPIRRSAPKVGRNDPCPCGSGKKYKRCHGQTDGRPGE